MQIVYTSNSAIVSDMHVISAEISVCMLKVAVLFDIYVQFY